MQSLAFCQLTPYVEQRIESAGKREKTMKNKNWLFALTLCALAGQASSQDSVWRYVDGGHVSYSNVPIKGKKGEKIKMMSHPAPVARPVQYDAPREQSGGAAPVGAPAAIPAELLRQIKTGSGDRPPLPPMGLPPLPSMPGAVALPRAAVAAATPVRAQSSAPAVGQFAPSRAEPEAERPAAPSGPSWARQGASASAQAPSWAKDPFSQ